MIRPVRRAASLAAGGVAWLALSLGGCGESEGAGAVVRVDTLRSGTVRVSNPGEGVWTPEEAWTLEEDLRLGSQAGGGAGFFSRIAALTTDPDGRIYVLDDPSQEIRVFSSDGELLRTLGGRGDGPGELRGAAGLDWDAEGRLWVWGGSRYVVLEPTGEEVARYDRPVSGVIFSWMGGFDDRGRYIDFDLDRELLGTRRVGRSMLWIQSGRTTFLPVAFTPPDRVDSLPPLEFQAEVTEDGALKRGSKTIEAFQDGDDVWFAHSDAYTVYRRRLSGDTLLQFTLPSRPMPIPAAEIDSVLAEDSARYGPAARMTREHFVRHRHLITNLVTGEDGRIYVFPEEEGVPGGTVVDVFESSGVHLGRVEIPDRILTEGPSPHVTARHLYAVVTDERGVPFVVRYRIRRPPG